MYDFIIASPGIKVLVDSIDFPWISMHKWNIAAGGYCVRSPKVSEKRPGTLYLHREIMLAGKGFDVDHINGDKLDNRRNNLRICTRSQNGANQRRRRKSTSKFKGVSFCSQTLKWRADLTANGKFLNLGRYKTEIEAAEAYDEAAIKYFGEFAFTNAQRLILTTKENENDR